MTQFASYPVNSVGSVSQGTPAAIGNAWPVKITDTTNIATVTAGGALKVDASASTQPISGTVTANQGGTWNIATVTAVTGITNALPAGANVIGGVTQSGTWNIATVTAVTAITNALPTGANVIGGVTQSGTWNVGTVTTVTAVTAITNALPTGANVIGAVTQSGTWNVGTVTTVTAVTAITNALPTGANVIGAVTQSGSWTVTANAGTGTFTTDQLATTAAAWQTEGSIAGTSLTTNFATALTVSGTLVWVGIRNNTNGIVVVSLDSGTTSAFSLDAGDQISLDLKTMGRSIANAVTIQAKYSGSAPTTGTFRVNGIH